MSGPITPEMVDDLIESFEKKYEELYGEGAAYREAGVEITTFRVDAVGRMPKPELREYESTTTDPSSAQMGEREVYFDEPGDWQFKYQYRRLEADAWLDTFPDSDSMSGSTNAKGHELVFGLGLGKNWEMGLDYYDTEKIEGSTEKRILQADMKYKF